MKALRLGIQLKWRKLSLLIGIACLGCGSAFAFKPLEAGWYLLFGTQGGAFDAADYTHELVTRLALEGSAVELFGTGKKPASFISALQEVVDANAEVDLVDATCEECHFDSESVLAAHQRLLTLAEQVKISLDRGNLQGARQKLGQALHTLQDFYSHSNWIELSNKVINPYIGQPGATPFLALSNSLAKPTQLTCVDCALEGPCDNNILGPDLTTGYFQPPGPFRKTFGKCSHGGPLDGTSDEHAYGGINKDTSVGSESPHYFLHRTAGELAVAATQQYLKDLKLKINNSRHWQQLFGFGDMLILANNNRTSPVRLWLKIDGFYIAEDGAISLGTLLEGFPPEISLRNLQSKEILLPDLGLSRPYLMELYGVDSESATGLIGYSVTLPSALEFVQVRSDRGETTRIPGTYSHSDLFVLKPVGNVSARHRQNIYTIKRSTYPRILSLGPSSPAFAGAAVDILSVAAVSDNTPKSFTFPVDPSIKYLSIWLTGATTAEIKRPNGAIVQSSDSGVAIQPQTGGVSYVVPVTAIGNWTISITPALGNFELAVSASSAIEFSRFEFVQLAGRPGHQGFFPLPGEPIVNQPNYVHAITSSNIASAQFELRKPSGETIRKLDLAQEPGPAGGSYFGQVDPPDSSFLPYLNGVDSNGFRFQRVAPRAWKSQTIAVTASTRPDLNPGQITKYKFQVENFGETSEFRILASDSRGYLTNVSPQAVLIEKRQRKEVTVTVSTPQDAQVGMSDVITLTAESAVSAVVRNSSTVIVGIFASAAPLVSPPELAISRNENEITLRWTSGATLQWAGDPSGPWQDLVGDFNSITIVPVGRQKYYRARR